MTEVHRLRRRFRPRRRPRITGLSFNQLIPNILTLIGLCAGLTSIRFGLEGKFGAAVTAITVAMAIDGLDGRIARLLKGTSRFGAEFDSLADFLCFGVAPALLLYMWSLASMRGYGYAPCIMFVVCMGLRLARFNATLDSEKRPAYAYNFFTGVPAPAGAGLVLFPLLVGLEGQAQDWPWMYNAAVFPLVSAGVLIGTSVLLVSTLPVWSFKNFKIRSEYVLPTLLGVGLFAALLLADPWAALALAGIIYAGMLPFGVRSFRRLKQEAERRRQEAMEMDAGFDAAESGAA
jgi:CDP-diacylglycerol--serine O-phosphatidyltransferase